MNYKITGKVKTGLGEAAFWTNKINRIFQERYDMTLFPGTLNIEVEKEYILEETGDIIHPSEYNGKYNVLLQKCKIFESIAYIVRPEINNKKGGTHSLNILELVSEQNLRKTYNLKDNDKIEIEVIK